MNKTSGISNTLVQSNPNPSVITATATSSTFNKTAKIALKILLCLAVGGIVGAALSLFATVSIALGPAILLGAAAATAIALTVLLGYGIYKIYKGYPAYRLRILIQKAETLIAKAKTLSLPTDVEQAEKIIAQMNRYFTEISKKLSGNNFPRQLLLEYNSLKNSLPDHHCRKLQQDIQNILTQPALTRAEFLRIIWPKQIALKEKQKFASPALKSSIAAYYETLTGSNGSIMTRAKELR